jgi:tetratricopeptide (TPR) repeat protein
MNKKQWITAGIAFLLVIVLYASTQKQILGTQDLKKLTTPTQINSSALISTDSILYQAKKDLSSDQITRLDLLEHSITRGNVKQQQIDIYHHLAQFWSDTAHKFEPYAWYIAEEARLENSEKSFTFAARLFLNGLSSEEKPAVRQWEALQAKDLFERSLKINPHNDSSRVGLGAVYLYGGLESPMQGIGMIKEVADRDPSNIYAQMTLGQASMASGQMDKAIERFKKVIELQADNVEALLLLAEVKEQMGNKTEAIDWYSKSLPLIKNSGIKKEVMARIADLRK